MGQLILVNSAQEAPTEIQLFLAQERINDLEQKLSHTQQNYSTYISEAVQAERFSAPIVAGISLIMIVNTIVNFFINTNGFSWKLLLKSLLSVVNISILLAAIASCIKPILDRIRS